MFRFGIGVEIDEQRALEHLIAAADSGESNAQIMLAHATAGVQQELLSVEVNDTATGRHPPLPEEAGPPHPHSAPANAAGPGRTRGAKETLR